MSTLIGGVQDIAALLPLLGTEQCEDHINCALRRGFLYAAATPMSIFGSLGIARAGFKVLFASVTVEHWNLVGAQKLKDSGFKPIGASDSVSSLIMLDNDCHLAETRLIEFLRDQHVDSFEKLEVQTNCKTWNINMMITSIALGVLGITPYLYLNIHSASSLPVYLRWTFPITRVLGSCLAATMVQFVVQMRMLAILKHRLVFMALDPLVVSNNVPIRWSSQKPSEKALWNLSKYLRVNDTSTGSAMQLFIVIKRFIKNLITKRTLTKDGYEHRKDEGDPEKGPDETSSSEGRLVQGGLPESIHDTERIDKGSGDEPRSDPTPPRSAVSDDGAKPNDIVLQELIQLKSRLETKHFSTGRTFSQARLLLCQSFLLIGLMLTVVGYVGCFTVVQRSSGVTGPLIWLCLEGALSLMRIFLWAWNPQKDDLGPILLSLTLASHPPFISSNWSAEKMETDKLFPFVLGKDFLPAVTSYAGPLPPFLYENVSLYYTLTLRLDQMKRVLYITVLDHEWRTWRLFNPEPLTSSTTIRDASLLGFDLADLSHQLPESNHITRDETFLRHLAAHHRSIVEALSRQGVGTKGIPIHWTVDGFSESVPENGIPGGGHAIALNIPEATVTDTDHEYIREGDVQLWKIRQSQINRDWIGHYMQVVRKEMQGEMSIFGNNQAKEAALLLLEEWEEMERLHIHQTRKLEEVLLHHHRSMLASIHRRKENEKASIHDGSIPTESEMDWSLQLKARLTLKWKKDTRSRLIDEEGHARRRLEDEKSQQWLLMGVDRLSAHDKVCIERRWTKVEAIMKNIWRTVIDDFTNSAVIESGDCTSSIEEKESDSSKRPNILPWVRRRMEERLTEEKSAMTTRLQQEATKWEDHQISETIAYLSFGKYLKVERKMIDSEGMAAIVSSLKRNRGLAVIDIADLDSDHSCDIHAVIGGKMNMKTVGLDLADIKSVNRISTDGPIFSYEHIHVSTVQGESRLVFDRELESKCTIHFPEPSKGNWVLRLNFDRDLSAERATEFTVEDQHTFTYVVDPRNGKDEFGIREIPISRSVVRSQSKLSFLLKSGSCYLSDIAVHPIFGDNVLADNPGRTYLIQNVATRLYMDMAGAEPYGDIINWQLNVFGNRRNQQWTYEQSESNVYLHGSDPPSYLYTSENFRVVASPKYRSSLQITQCETSFTIKVGNFYLTSRGKDWRELLLEPSDNSDNQKWFFHPASE